MNDQLQSELIQVIHELRSLITQYRTNTSFDKLHPRLPAAEIAINISELFIKNEIYVPTQSIEIWFQQGRNVEDAFQGTQFDSAIKLYYRMVELCKELYWR
jgi:hypothetical protein